MVILALDTATVTGWALGEAGKIPASGSVRLKRPQDHRDVAPFNAQCFLRDMWETAQPDLVVIEEFMNPAAQKSADAISLQLMVYGVVVALCQSYTIPYRAVHRMTIVKHFLGPQRRQQRAELKAKVVGRAILLGYMPRGHTDQNRADACAAFDYGAAYFARVPPAELVMFGEEAS